MSGDSGESNGVESGDEYLYDDYRSLGMGLTTVGNLYRKYYESRTNIHRK